jgi:hypothetical protein
MWTTALPGARMAAMDRQPPRPDRDRLSTLTALVLLAYSLTRIVILPAWSVEFTALGLILRLEVNALFVMLALAAALTAAGADWLIQAHPWHTSGQPTYPHWIIPGLASLAAWAILSRIPQGPAWWIGLGLAALLLLTVLVTEFVVFDPDDPRYDGAAVGLTALAYLLLVGVLFAIQAAALRATFAVPLVLAASSGVSWRLLRLQAPRSPVLRYALLVGLGIAQMAWGLHYWPVTPLRAALVLGLGAYVATGLALAHLRGSIDRASLLEFGAVAAMAMAVILFVA